MKLKLPYPRKNTVECPLSLERVLRSSFPYYSGRKFHLRVATFVCCSDTYWDGGSKAEYVFVNLTTNKVMYLPDLISGGYAPHANQALEVLGNVELKPGLAVIRHSIFRGKDMGLEITLHPDNMVALLPEVTA